jgi:diguanylate cyclase (GGDEF)-like protein
MPVRTKILLFATTAVTLVMAVTAAVGPFTLFWTDDTRSQRNVVERQINSIRYVQSLLLDAETGQRGYALTGDEVFLQPYYIAGSQMPTALKNLRLEYQDDFPDQVAQVEDLIKHATQEMDQLDQAVRLRTESGYDAAKADAETGRSKQIMDYVRGLSVDLIFDETHEIAQLDNRLHANLRWAVAISVGTFLLTLALGRFIYISMRKAIQLQTESAGVAQTMSRELSESVGRLERRNKEIGLLAEMARLMQTELTQEETLQLASTYCRQLLLNSSGTFFLYRHSRDVLEKAALWGEAVDQDEPLSPMDCWSLRRDRWHMACDSNDLCCNHYTITADSADMTHCCLPLVAYGEVLGLLHICQKGSRAEAEGSIQFTEAIAEQTALALANGRLRQVLQTQSIKDPLTGLYNRRFMEETLERELARARRNNTPLSVILLDLDHFKSLNDQYGHSAGDAVLRASAVLLAQCLRTTDIACRFGGEELVVILPECRLEDAVSRAEAIRAAFEGMRLPELEQTLAVTASFGVASTTLCGTDQNALIKAADAALYRAKRAGRNRVECDAVSQ